MSEVHESPLALQLGEPQTPLLQVRPEQHWESDEQETPLDLQDAQAPLEQYGTEEQHCESEEHDAPDVLQAQEPPLHEPEQQSESEEHEMPLSRHRVAHTPAEQVPEQHCAPEEHVAPSELQVQAPLVQALEQHWEPDVHWPPTFMQAQMPAWQLPEQQSEDEAQVAFCCLQAGVALIAIFMHWPTRGTLLVSVSPFPLLS
jgi:hypothetical protein